MGQLERESGTARKEGHRRLADEGLSLREIAEQTGHPKSTVHRDLDGYLPSESKKLTAQARTLYKLQVQERGLRPGPIVDGKQLVVPGPYVSTPEREQRASRIIDLRKRAAHIDHPIAA